MDPLTGIITVKEPGTSFDRELVSRHYLTVEARDDLGKGNRNTVQLIVNVNDVNDNAPIFLQNKYEAVLLENEDHFQSPLIVEAFDIDLNGSILSHIIINNSSRSISIILSSYTFETKVPRTAKWCTLWCRENFRGILVSIRGKALLHRQHLWITKRCPSVKGTRKRRCAH